MRISHHIIDDHWSWDMFFKELVLLYEAQLRGNEPPLPESEPLHYADYTAWQRRVLSPGQPAYENAVAWWKDQLAGQPCPPELPFRRPQPLAGISPDEGSLQRRLESEISERLNRLGQEASATQYTVRLAAFTAFLAAETGQADVVLGSYFSNRNRIELQKIFGYFDNLATLRLHCDETRTFRQWVSVVGNKVNDVRARCDLPYEQLCEELRRLGVDAPEIRVIFNANERLTMLLGRAEMTWQERPRTSMPWGFSLCFNQRSEGHFIAVTFDARLYDPKGVRAMVDRLCRFLDAVSRNPDRQLSELLAPGFCRDAFRRAVNGLLMMAQNLNNRIVKRRARR
jgi:hypothetical protein